MVLPAPAEVEAELAALAAVAALKADGNACAPWLPHALLPQDPSAAHGMLYLRSKLPWAVTCGTASASADACLGTAVSVAVGVDRVQRLP